MTDSMKPVKQAPFSGFAGFGGGLGTLSSAASDPTYVDDVFSSFLYDGDGSSSRTITNNIDISGEGGLVWVKQRNESRGHNLSDTERGATKILSTNNNGAEGTYTTTITDFTSTGFSVGSDSGVNHSSGEYSSWSFRKAPGFFDVITWTGDGVNGRQIAHDLGSTPGMSIIKCRSSSSRDFIVRHENMSSDKVCFMNSTSAELDNPGGYQTHSSTHLTLNSAGGANGLIGVNNSGDTYVAYVFANNDASFGTDSDEAIIKCGQFEAVGGTEVNLGFEPQWVLIKRIDGARDWFLIDNMRGLSATSTVNSQYLSPNDSDAETSNRNIFLTPTGFTVAPSTAFNNDTHIYMAIRRQHKPPTAGTDVFDVQASSNDANGTSTSSSITADLAISAFRDLSSVDKWVATRLLGNGEILRANATSAADSYSQFSFDQQFGVKHTGFTGANNVIEYTLRRAPGFFDVVAAVYPSISAAIPHNLGVAPELIINKPRDGNIVWMVGSDYLQNTNGWNRAIELNSDASEGSTSVTWDQTAPTATHFTVGSYPGTSYKGIFYLFATLDGISKVGSYSGTGSNVNVDCGFAAGARFVLIKRTDSSGDWYFWDTTRGIVSGNDPYSLMNTTDVEVTNTDYIDPLNAGFTVTSSAPAALNTSGGTYLFLAIA